MYDIGIHVLSDVKSDSTTRAAVMESVWYARGGGGAPEAYEGSLKSSPVELGVLLLVRRTELRSVDRSLRKVSSLDVLSTSITMRDFER